MNQRRPSFTSWNGLTKRLNPDNCDYLFGHPPEEHLFLWDLAVDPEHQR
jgi:hypothetical protein